YNMIIGVGADDELSLPPKNSNILNNIFYKSSNPFVIKISEPQNFTWEGNSFYGSETGIGLPQSEDPKLKKDDSGIYRITYDFLTSFNPADMPLNPLTNKEIILWNRNNPIAKKDTGPLWEKDYFYFFYSFFLASILILKAMHKPEAKKLYQQFQH